MTEPPLERVPGVLEDPRSLGVPGALGDPGRLRRPVEHERLDALEAEEDVEGVGGGGSHRSRRDPPAPERSPHPEREVGADAVFVLPPSQVDASGQLVAPPDGEAPLRPVDDVVIVDVFAEPQVRRRRGLRGDRPLLRAARSADREVPVRAEVGSLAESDRTGFMARVVGRELGLT